MHHPPEPEQASPPAAQTASGSGIPLWLALVGGVAALVFAVVVIGQIASPLAGLLAPAEPPFFQPATLLEHRRIDNGVDEWLYATDAPGCEVYAWYQERAEFCRPSPGVTCVAGDSGRVGDAEYSIGYCQGSEPFGSFAADWEIYISDGYNEGDMRTRFLIAREVDWLNQH